MMVRFGGRFVMSWSSGFTLFGVKFFEDHDFVEPTASATALKMCEDAQQRAANETGWDRLRSVFQSDEFGYMSPEIENSLICAMAGLLCGSAAGGFASSKQEYSDFIDRNKATAFSDHFEAKKQLQHKVTKAMATGAFRLGWRMALFTGSYTFFTTLVSTYRGKSSVVEYTAGGALAGATYKTMMGPRAMLAGAVAGGVLGTFAGGATVAIMTLTGTTTEQVRYWRSGWKEAQVRELTSVELNRRRAQAIGPLAVAHELALINKVPEPQPESQNQQPQPESLPSEEQLRPEPKSEPESNNNRSHL